MIESYWYYMKEGKEEGPIPESKLKEMLSSGYLVPDTQVRSESMIQWKKAVQLDEFRSLFALSVIKEYAPSIPVKLGEQKDAFDVKSFPEVSPWHRWFARSIDYFFCSIILVIPISTILVIYSKNQEQASRFEDTFFTIFYLVLPFLWIFIEALFLSKWATTPGKWLVNITVRTQSEDKLTYRQALSRSFMVLFWGMGLGIPLFGFIMNVISYYDLSNKG